MNTLAVRMATLAEAVATYSQGLQPFTERESAETYASGRFALDALQRPAR